MKRAGSGWEVDAWGGPVGRYELFDEYVPYRSYEYEADFGIDIYYGGAKVAELDYDRLEGDSQSMLYDMLESAYMRNVDMGTYLDRYVSEIEAELRDCEETIEDEGYVDTDKRGWWSDAFSDGFGGLIFRMLTDSPIPDFSERRASVRRGAFDAPHASNADELAVLALRQSLEGENQAIYDYQNWVNQLPEGHPVREGLVDIMREERAHVGELQQMLFDMGFDEENDFEDGRVEVDTGDERTGMHKGKMPSKYDAVIVGHVDGSPVIAIGANGNSDSVSILKKLIEYVGRHYLQWVLDETNENTVYIACTDRPDISPELLKIVSNLTYGTAKLDYGFWEISNMNEWFTYGGSMQTSIFRDGCNMRRFAFTVKDNITGDIYDCETVGDLEDCLRDITPEDAPGYELIDDVAHMANDNYFVDLENALGVAITAKKLRRASSASWELIYSDSRFGSSYKKAIDDSGSTMVVFLDEAVGGYVVAESEDGGKTHGYYLSPSGEFDAAPWGNKVLAFGTAEEAMEYADSWGNRRQGGAIVKGKAFRKHAGRSQLYIDWIVASILDKAPFRSQSDLSAAIDDAINYYVRTDREVREVAEDFVPEDLIPSGGLESMTADEMWDAFIDGFADTVQDTLDSYGTRLVARRSGAFGGRKRRTAGMYDIPGGAIETYQDGGRWYARAFQYGEYVTGRCYGRSEEEAVNKCKKELSRWGFDVAGRRARRDAPRRASRRKVAVNGASFSNGWTMYLDTRSDGSFSVTLYDPDGYEHDYDKTFEAGDEYSLVRQLRGIMAWRAPMGIDDYDKIDEMAAKAFGRYGRRAMRMRAV